MWSSILSFQFADGKLEAETEAHAGKYACKPSMKVFFFSFFKEWIFIYLLAALQPVES